jgi:tetratricopeptide (TPR) repeat protein
MANNFKEARQGLFASWLINLDEIPLEQLDHYIAVENYLTDNDELPPNAVNIEKVQGYLEAFHQLSEVEDWTRAKEVLFTRFNTPTTEELRSQLFVWGYYQELAKLCNSLLGKLKGKLDAILLNNLGNLQGIFGNYIKAINYHEKSLSIAQGIGDRRI